MLCAGLGWFWYDEYREEAKRELIKILPKIIEELNVVDDGNVNAIFKKYYENSGYSCLQISHKNMSIIKVLEEFKIADHEQTPEMKMEELGLFRRALLDNKDALCVKIKAYTTLRALSGSFNASISVNRNW